MLNEMIERVALALYVAEHHPGTDIDPSELEGETKDRLMYSARAAIKAMLDMITEALK